MKRSHCLALIYIILFTANLQLFECRREDDRSFTGVLGVSSSLPAYRFLQDISRYTTRTRQIRSPWGVPFHFELPRLEVLPPRESVDFSSLKSLLERESWPKTHFETQDASPWWSAGAPPRKIHLEKLSTSLHDGPQSRISPSSSVDLPPSKSAGSPSRLSPPVKLPPSLSEEVPPQLSHPLSAEPPPSLSAGPQSRLLPPPSAELPSSVLGGPSSRLTPSQSLPTSSKHNRPNHNDLPSEESHRSSGTNQGNEFSESALRFHPGYKITNFTGGGNNNIKYINAGDIDFAQYSAAHFGEHGIPADTNIESDIRICKNITFCMPNTSPLCVMNGTVYCVTPLRSTVVCNETAAKMKCVNSTINLPCNTTTSANCNGKTTNAISIPCVTIIHVFTTNVSRISKRSVVNTPNLGNKYCVTLAAEPIKKPEISLDTSDEEYAQFLNTNDAMKKAPQKWFLIYVILQTISRYVFGWDTMLIRS